MAGLSMVKRGGRVDRICKGCHKVIPAKTSHLWLTRIDRYHIECKDLYKPKSKKTGIQTIVEPQASEVPTTEPQVSEVQVAATTESTEADPPKDEYALLRNKLGRFIRKA